MKQINQDLLSKRIDNLPYSIKPKHFDEFKKNLTKSLNFRLTPDGPSFLEVMFSTYKRELEKKNIYVSQNQLLEHTMIMCSLMKTPVLTKTGDEVEYEMREYGYTPKEYWDILWEPFKELRNIIKEYGDNN